MKKNNKKDLLWIYRAMKTSRYFEERMEKAYLEGKQPVFNIGAGPVPGEMHLSNGQEPAAASMIVHLTKDDTVTATHRPHHQAIAKGVDLKKMLKYSEKKRDWEKEKVVTCIYLIPLLSFPVVV